MTTLEITLILVGIVFLIGSFMVKDKLSKNDLDKIADMSAEELKVITEKEIKNAELAIDGMLDEHIASKTDETKRDLEKETNSKIMAINEYSDTVLDSINKSHNEIMFLYSMLNDKHEELTRLSGNIEKITLSGSVSDGFMIELSIVLNFILDNLNIEVNENDIEADTWFDTIEHNGKSFWLSKKFIPKLYV